MMRGLHGNVSHFIIDHRKIPYAIRIFKSVARPHIILNNAPPDIAISYPKIAGQLPGKHIKGTVS